MYGLSGTLCSRSYGDGERAILRGRCAEQRILSGMPKEVEAVRVRLLSVLRGTVGSGGCSVHAVCPMSGETSAVA